MATEKPALYKLSEEDVQGLLADIGRAVAFKAMAAHRAPPPEQEAQRERVLAEGKRALAVLVAAWHLDGRGAAPAKPVEPSTSDSRRSAQIGRRRAALDELRALTPRVAR